MLESRVIKRALIPSVFEFPQLRSWLEVLDQHLFIIASAASLLVTFIMWINI